MRRFAALAISAAAALAASNAHALIVVVDDFNSPAGAQTVFDTVGAAGGGVTGATLATSAGNVATSRTITHTLLTAGANPIGSFSSASVGSSSIPAGALAMNNGSTVDSVVSVDWAMPVQTLTGPVSFFFRVIQSNFGVPAASNTLDFNLKYGPNPGDTAFIGAFSIGNVSNTDVIFGLTDAQRTVLNLGGVLTMTVNGNEDWDLSLDQFALQLPEPTSLALAGLALLGAGALTRRRKA